MKQIILLTVLLFNLWLPQPAKADYFKEYVFVDCIPEFNYLKIRNNTIYGEEAHKVTLEKPDEMWNKYRVMVVSNPRYEKYTSRELTCELDNGDIYEIAIKSTEIYGATTFFCQDAETIELTITLNGKHFIDQLPFTFNKHGELDCHDVVWLGGLKFDYDRQYLNFSIDGTSIYLDEMLEIENKKERRKFITDKLFKKEYPS